MRTQDHVTAIMESMLADAAEKKPPRDRMNEAEFLEALRGEATPSRVAATRDVGIHDLIEHLAAQPVGSTSMLLREYADNRAMMRVDREAGVIKGVRILGLESKNGRRYKRDAAGRAIPMYEGAPVNIDHRGQPGTRSYSDRIGVLRNVSQASDGGLVGDLHYNPKHPLAEQLCWDAEHAPHNVGLSHQVEGRTSRGADGKLIIEEITKVVSVDLVAEPATTRGLFESKDMNGAEFLQAVAS